MSEERERKDQLLSQTMTTEKQLEAKNRALGESQSYIEDMERKLSELSLGVQSKDECLAKMVATRQSLAVEVAAMKEDGEHLRGQLNEAGTQLQIAHSRILTLEAKILKSSMYRE